MEHIKKYKIFESEIRKTFVDWLDNPKKSNNYVYKFQFPVKKIFNIDTKWDSVDLIEFLKKERGVDICSIISKDIEKEYVESEIPSIEISDDEVLANFKRYFQEWLKLIYNNKIDRFYRMYDLDFQEYRISEEEFISLKDDFNSQNFSIKYPKREFNYNFDIKSILIEEFIDDNKIIGNITVNRILKNEEIESICDFIESECSDGWGEIYENSSVDDIDIEGLKFWTSIKVWWSDGYPIWNIEITQD